MKLAIDTWEEILGEFLVHFAKIVPIKIKKTVSMLAKVFHYGFTYI